MANKIQILRNITNASTDPATLQEGELAVNLLSTPPYLMVGSAGGSSVLPVGPVIYQASEPSTARDGALWVNSSTNKFYFKSNGTWIILESTITTNTTLYLANTGDDVTGDGSLSTPWETPQKAFDWLSYFKIANGVTVTISVDAGNYDLDVIEIDHPDGHRIEMVGDSMLGNKPWGCPLGDYSSDPMSPTVPSRGADELYNTAGTVGADADESTRETARDADVISNDAFIRTRYATQFTFATDSGIVVKGSGTLGLLNNIALIGNQAANQCGIKVDAGDPGLGSVALGTNVAIHRFETGINVINGGVVSAKEVTVSGCKLNGIFIKSGGNVDADESTIVGNVENGLRIYNSGSALCTSSKVSGNGHSGVMIEGHGGLNGYLTEFSGNGRHGVHVLNSGSTDTEIATSTGNGGNGFFVEKNGSIYANSGEAVGNGNCGAFVEYGGTIDIADGTTSTNINSSLAVSYGGVINALGCFVDVVYPSGSPPITPAADVYANGSGIIRVEGGSSCSVQDVTFDPEYGTVGNGNSLIQAHEPNTSGPVLVSVATLTPTKLELTFSDDVVITDTEGLEYRINDGSWTEITSYESTGDGKVWNVVIGDSIGNEDTVAFRNTNCVSVV